VLPICNEEQTERLAEGTYLVGLDQSTGISLWMLEASKLNQDVLPSDGRIKEPEWGIYCFISSAERHYLLISVILVPSSDRLYINPLFEKMNPMMGSCKVLVLISPPAPKVASATLPSTPAFQP